MTRWWCCVNLGCPDMEKVSSADTAELAVCTTCHKPLVLVSEDEEWEDQTTDVDLPKGEVRL